MSSASMKDATENNPSDSSGNKSPRGKMQKEFTSSSQPKKRNKPSLVCSNCKRRKIKCDRRLPCSSCVKMKCGYECSYEPKWQSIAYEGTGKSPISPLARGSESDSSSISNGGVGPTGKGNGNGNGNVHATSSSSIWLTNRASTDPETQSLQNRILSLETSFPPLSEDERLNVENTEDAPVQTNNKTTSTSASTSTSAAVVQPISPDLTSRDDTFGYNPVGSEDETINFYEGYTPFHVKEPLRRINHGPLAWAAYMRKDPWLLVLWIFSTGEKNGFPYLLFTGSAEVTREKLNDLNADEGKQGGGVDVAFKKRALQIDGYEEAAPISSILMPLVSSSTTAATTNSSRVNENTVKKGLPHSHSISKPQPHSTRIGVTNVNTLGSAADACSTRPSSTGTNPSAVFVDGSSFKFNSDKFNQSTATLGQSLFREKVNPDIELISQIKLIMPKRKVIWKLLDHFFDFLYPYMPFLDEVDFKMKISAIIGPELFKDVEVENVKIVNKLDLANLAIFFIVLRLSYVSLFDNKLAVNEMILNSTDVDPQIQNLKYLMNDPISVSVVDTAKLCLNRFEITRKTNMTIFQCFFFVRLYNIYSPEEGDGHDGGDSKVLTGMLIQMAYSLGLNREPDNFPDVFNDERVNLLGRKMWYFLVREDLTSCLSIGNVSTISPKHFDTKPPFYKEGNANVSKIDMELATIQIYKWFSARAHEIRKIADMVLDINGQISMVELTKAITYLEREANTEETFDGPYKRIHTDTMMKAYQSMRIKIFLFLKSTLLSLLYHTYLYYEDKLNYELSFYYLKKMCSLTLYYILPSSFDILCGKLSKNGLTLNPSLQLALHKSNQINIAAGVRVGYLVYNLESMLDHYTKLTSDNNYKRHFLSLESCFKAFIKCGDLFSRTLGKLALKYYYSWRILKAHAYLFQILTTKEFYQNLPNNVKKMRSFQFTTPQLEELTKIVKSIIKGLEQIVNFEDLQKTPNFSISSDISSSDSPPIVPQKQTLNRIDPQPVHNIDRNVRDVHNDDSVNHNTNFGIDGAITANSGFVPNADIDQMWLLVLALKFNQGGDSNTASIAQLNQRPLVIPMINHHINEMQPQQQLHQAHEVQPQQFFGQAGVFQGGQVPQYSPQTLAPPQQIGNFVSGTLPIQDNQYLQQQLQQQNLVAYFENDLTYDFLGGNNQPIQ